MLPTCSRIERYATQGLQNCEHNPKCPDAQLNDTGAPADADAENEIFAKASECNRNLRTHFDGNL